MKTQFTTIVAFCVLSVAALILARSIDEVNKNEAELDTMLAHFEDQPCSQKLRHYCFGEEYPLVYSKTHDRLCHPLMTCEENK